MTKQEFEDIYGKACFTNQELYTLIEKYKCAIRKMYFENPTIQWNTSTTQKLRDEIKIELAKQQTCLKTKTIRCAYCRQQIRGKMGEIEHILSKAKYRHLMFIPNNLVLCCETCNKAKLAYDLAINVELDSFILNLAIPENSNNNRKKDEKGKAKLFRKKLEKYDINEECFYAKMKDKNILNPLNDTDYLWVHPYYDDYFEHIYIDCEDATFLYRVPPHATQKQKDKATTMLKILNPEWNNEQNIINNKPANIANNITEIDS